MALGLLFACLLPAGSAADDPVKAVAQPEPAGRETAKKAPFEKLAVSPIMREVYSSGFLVPPPAPSDRGWLDDPFRHVEREMAIVIADLDEGEIQRPVTVEQPQIVERLDVMIEILEKARRGGGAGAAASASPVAPAGQSSLAGGPGGQGDMRAPGEGRRQWADLSPKQREKILQTRTEGFPAGYETLLEEYFRRLAREEPASADEPGSGDDNRK